MVMSVRPSIRVSVRQSQFSALFSYMLWHVELKFTCHFLLMNIRSSSSVVNFRQGVMPLLELKILEINSFLQFFLQALAYWAVSLHMTLFCWTTDQVSVSSISVIFFLGIMPLLELRLLEINSFLHFSLTCFDILSWNFVCHFLLMNIRSSLSVVDFRQFLLELCLFWNLVHIVH